MIVLYKCKGDYIILGFVGGGGGRMLLSDFQHWYGVSFF